MFDSIGSFFPYVLIALSLFFAYRIHVRGLKNEQNIDGSKTAVQPPPTPSDTPFARNLGRLANENRVEEGLSKIEVEESEKRAEQLFATIKQMLEANAVNQRYKRSGDTLIVSCIVETNYTLMTREQVPLSSSKHYRYTPNKRYSYYMNRLSELTSAEGITITPLLGYYDSVLNSVREATHFPAERYTSAPYSLDLCIKAECIVSNSSDNSI